MCLFHYILCLSPLLSPSSSSSSQSKPKNVYEMMRLTFLPNAHCNCQKYFYNDKKTNTPTVTNKATDGGFSKKRNPDLQVKKKKKSTKKKTPAKTSKGWWRSVPFTHPLTFEATSFKFSQKEASSQITLKLALHPRHRRALSHADPRYRRPLIFPHHPFPFSISIPPATSDPFKHTLTNPTP